MLDKVAKRWGRKDQQELGGPGRCQGQSRKQGRTGCPRVARVARKPCGVAARGCVPVPDTSCRFATPVASNQFHPAVAPLETGVGSIRDRRSTIRRSGGSIRDRGSSIRDRRGSIRDRGSSIRDRGSSIRDRWSSIRHLGSSIRDRGSSISGRGSSIMHLGSSIMDRGSSIWDRWSFISAQWRTLVENCRSLHGD